ncbi:predicted protein [Naegleria gruberi]|uniref:Predicted protein n=1 Tax=Naegleria gruberi TaxID=5762 RepID=D2V2A8_NAEGR|nr:uncharacterized protein NAEGRDRAFT_62937 [Naegleria gruberi]EFC48867.1 predicted protein [Naegleria gruberi]|eukprot:XP_002681611.1 predicted protein [Naegleria gruberi strain NEG-M]
MTDSLPPIPSLNFVYHLVSESAYLKDVQEHNGQYFNGDKRDGFLHMSIASEVEKSCKLYMHSVKDLIILKIDIKSLEARVSSSTVVEKIAYDWVPARSNYFPHLYGLLPVECIVDRISVPVVQDEHSFDGIHLDN